MTVCKTKRWGSSLGVVIPKTLVDEMHLTENQDIEIEVRSTTNPLQELFGFAKRRGLKKSTEEIIRETRKALRAD
ncbi:AbrB/MazE/SpoVT family DNA-binding domain-containing protein [Candidatus Woesearchaeota archaeon]|nr:AbrB/MazE/SpoVT family DNA-binding domain-containing protein [Candidatus Woesearchaeota archaeon]